MRQPIHRRLFLKQSSAALATMTAASVGLPFPLVRAASVKDPEASSIRKWAATLRGSVVAPGDAAYEQSRFGWNRAIDRRPRLIVRCADAADVVRSIEFARTRNMKIAVRSGGHSLAGHSTCEGGIIIDLGSIKGVQIDAAARVVRAAAGTRAAELLQATQAHGLATPTGGCPDVGIAGLTLGGGENALMGKYGAVCDNLLSAEVVTADGRVLTASRDANPDLYWAIRGGSGNFGVVTSFEYRLHALPDLLVTWMFFPVAQTREKLRRYRDLMVSAPDELFTVAGLLMRRQAPALGIGCIYCGDIASGEKLLEHWRATLDHPRLETMKAPYAADFVMPSAAMTGTGQFLPQLTDDAIDIFAAHFASAPPSTSALWNDYHGAVTRVSADAMAFSLRRRGFSLFAGTSWRTPAEQSAAIEWARSLERALQPHSRGVYVNNLFDEGVRAREAYGASYTRLSKIKAKYDPDNVFHLNHNIKPAA